MNYSKLGCLLAVILISFSSLEAQTKDEKKVVIVKKTIDKDGNETVEEIIMEGEDAKNFDLDAMGMENEEGHKVIRIEKEEEIKEDGEKEIHKEIKVIKVAEGEELTPEMIKELEEHGIDLNEIDGEDKVIRIEKWGEKEKIRVIKMDGDDNGKLSPEMIKELQENGVKIKGDKDKMIWISDDDERLAVQIDGDDEMEVGKEIIIKKKRDHSEQSLNLSSINININVGDDKKTLNLEFEGPKESTVVRIIDVEGKMVYTESLKNFSGKYGREIDLTDAAKGPVFLTIQQDENVFSEKVGM